MSIDFSLVSKEVADKCLKELYMDITEENVDEVVNRIKKYEASIEDVGQATFCGALPGR